MDYAQLARPVSSLAIISASATVIATIAASTTTMDHGSAHVSDLADQPDDPKVTIALSVASISITRRIQSTRDAFGQAELLGKISPPVPLDKGQPRA